MEKYEANVLLASLASHIDIKDIFYNEDKKVVIVKFGDGKKVVTHCHEGDEFDLLVGISLCVTKHIYRTRELIKVAKKVEDKKREKKTNVTA